MTLVTLAAVNFLAVPLIVAGCVLPGITVSRKWAAVLACGSHLAVLSLLAVELCVIVPFFELSLAFDGCDLRLPALGQLVRQMNAFLGATCAVPLITPILVCSGLETTMFRRRQRGEHGLPPWIRYVTAVLAGSFALFIATAVWLFVWTCMPLA